MIQRNERKIVRFELVLVGIEKIAKIELTGPQHWRGYKSIVDASPPYRYRLQQIPTDTDRGKCLPQVVGDHRIELMFVHIHL